MWPNSLEASTARSRCEFVPMRMVGSNLDSFNHHPLLQNILKLINERHCTMTAADLNFCTLCLALVYYNLAGEKIHLVIHSQFFIRL